MKLDDFINNEEVDFTKNCVTADDIKSIESVIGNSIGPELIDYLLKYGYLGFKHIEMYGINSAQLMDSDMITQTKYLHKYFEKTRPYIALENCGDGKFAMVSSEDEVFLYISDSDVLEDTKQKLSNYILNRFQEINN